MVSVQDLHYEHEISVQDCPTRAVRFNCNGEYLLTCGSDKTLKLINPYKNTLLKTYIGHGYEVLDCEASADSGKLVSCSSDRTVNYWDVSTGKIVRKFRGHLSRVNCCSFNQPDSTVIISGSYDATVRCWDTRSRSQDPVQIMDDAKDSIPSLKVSEQEILTGSVDGYVRNYDLRKGKLKEDCMGEPVTCVSFTEDEQCVLASCLDSTIKLIDKETGCVLNTYKSHTNKDFKIENSVAIKDSSVISGSEDGTLFIWDLITAEVTFERKKAHNSVLYGLSRHPSKNIFVTASTDSVKLWKDNEEKDEDE